MTASYFTYITLNSPNTGHEVNNLTSILVALTSDLRMLTITSIEWPAQVLWKIGLGLLIYNYNHVFLSFFHHAKPFGNSSTPH